MATMTTHETQTTCPDEGCNLEVPDMAEAIGWMVVGPLLWCPFHFPVERRRLHDYAQAVDFYQGNIRKCEQAVADHKDRVQYIRAWARYHKLWHKDPEVKRLLAEADARKAEAERRIPILTHKLELATMQHEQENEDRRELATRPVDGDEQLG
jgi:hypothetical protein